VLDLRLSDLLPGKQHRPVSVLDMHRVQCGTFLSQAVSDHDHRQAVKPQNYHFAFHRSLSQTKPTTSHPREEFTCHPTFFFFQNLPRVFLTFLFRYQLPECWACPTAQQPVVHSIFSAFHYNTHRQCYTGTPRQTVGGRRLNGERCNRQGVLL
jgi:hypothetical protein